MGKYGASLIHEWWSDWHHYLNNPRIKKTAFMTDIDVTETTEGAVKRNWAELRKQKGIVAVLDLKWKWSVDLGMEKLTVPEIILMNFYEQHSIPFLIIVIDPRNETPTFHIHRPYNDKNKTNSETIATLTETQMIQWINNDYDFTFLTNLSQPQSFEVVKFLEDKS